VIAMSRVRVLFLAALLLAAAPAAWVVGATTQAARAAQAAQAAQAASTAVMIDGRQGGRTFDGVGALALSFQGSRITASVDGQAVGSVTNSSYPKGQVGIATSQMIGAQFDNLSIG
jgi:hypothetical protein